MQFPTPLLSGTLIKRYKRFLADIRLENGEEITAHCVNSGSMLGLKDEGSPVYITKVPEEAKRKLRYDWQFIEDIHNNNKWVGINTSWPNNLVEEALLNKRLPELAAYPEFRREVKYGLQNSRIDFYLSGGGLPPCYLEIKNVTLKVGDTAQFPDAVTARGKKHLEELTHMAQEGFRAIVLYVVQRQDCIHFEVASHIDPAYASTAQQAKEKGVEFLCYSCDITKEGITIDTTLPIK
ncbi:MAG TPA: DNA/RNA nuclease SfsA [Holosporales bacterium]|nr:DNA/RNA nuclease SfsA [Holosporales bacterium]